MSRVSKNIEYRIWNIELVYSKFKIPNSIFCPNGFTIVELLVSIAIIVILSTVLFANYPESLTRISLANTTHKLALLVREAQVRGSAVDSKSNLISGYGIYVKKTDQYNVILFSDFSTGGTVDPRTGIALGNRTYDSNETVSTLKIPKGFRISNFCFWDFPNPACSAGNTTNSLTVSFTRPNPRPNIYSSDVIGRDYIKACIEIQTLNNPILPGHTRSVLVYNTGFITTSDKSCNIAIW